MPHQRGRKDREPDQNSATHAWPPRSLTASGVQIGPGRAGPAWTCSIGPGKEKRGTSSTRGEIPLRPAGPPPRPLYRCEAGRPPPRSTRGIPSIAVTPGTDRTAERPRRAWRRCRPRPNRPGGPAWSRRRRGGRPSPPLVTLDDEVWSDRRAARSDVAGGTRPAATPAEQAAADTTINGPGSASSSGCSPHRDHGPAPAGAARAEAVLLRMETPRLSLRDRIEAIHRGLGHRAEPQWLDTDCRTTPTPPPSVNTGDPDFTIGLQHHDSRQERHSSRQSRPKTCGTLFSIV